MLKRCLSLFALVFAIGFVAPSLSGCESMQVAKGPNSTSALMYSGIAEARTQLRIAVDADKVSAAKATEIRTQLRGAQDALDTYDATGNADALAKSRAALAAVRAYLLTQGATFK